jgi:hypothetical protein
LEVLRTANATGNNPQQQAGSCIFGRRLDDLTRAETMTDTRNTACQ